MTLTHKEMLAILPKMNSRFEYAGLIFKVCYVNPGQKRVTAELVDLAPKTITDMVNNELAPELRDLIKRLHADIKGTNPQNVTLDVHSSTIGSGSKFQEPKKGDGDAK